MKHIRRQVIEQGIQLTRRGRNISPSFLDPSSVSIPGLLQVRRRHACLFDRQMTSHQLENSISHLQDVVGRPWNSWKIAEVLRGVHLLVG